MTIPLTLETLQQTMLAKHNFAADLMKVMLFSSKPAPRYVVAFDQSLTATGCVVLDLKGDEPRLMAPAVQLDLVDAVVFTSEAPVGGHQGNIMRTRRLSDTISSYFRGSAYFDSTILIIEHPPVATGKIKRPEASLLAAAAISFALDADPFYVGASEARSMICGVVGKKSDLMRVFNHQFPSLMAQLTGHANNEATRDAMALALAGLMKFYRGDFDV
jgi:hypothetical protein